MPWYRSGTVAITAGQTTVTGTGTDFAANSRVGDAFQGPDGRWYEVANIASATVLSILPAYQGATTSAGAYGLAPMQGYVKDSADALRAIVNQYGAKLAALGTTGNYDILPVAKGGTGGATAADARAGIGAAAKGANSDITSLTGLSTALTVAQGGTGAANAASARANLGVSYGAVAGSVAEGNDSRLVNALQTNTAGILSSLRITASGPQLSTGAGYLISSATLFPPGYRSSNGAGASGANQWNLFWGVSGMQVWVDGSNTGTIQYTASDERIKEGITYTDDSAGDLSLIEALKPVTYRFSERGPIARSELKRGFIAQDVLATEKMLVTGEVIEGETKDDITSILSLDSLGLISYLVGAVKQLSTRNSDLERRLSLIEAERAPAD